ncbi:MAG: ABC-type heme uptake system substrate-binding component HmuT [Rhodobacteraceae bacterium HLUCCA12]|nr:MAG: ABC-type heme uptake system substrate-binding component HmuT [Rhodobacteraceae bacterium HLUCCA12]
MTRCLFLRAGLAGLALGALTLPAIAADRVVVVGGALAEIVHALGHADRLVGRDTTATHPAAIAALPDVGYMRALSPEGLLRLEPDLILADAGAGPPQTIELMERAEVPFVQVDQAYTEDGVLGRIDAVAEVFDDAEGGAALAADVEARFADLAAARDRIDAPIRAMFILSAEGGRIMASGTDTAASGILALAGLENAVTGFEGYQLLTDEAVAAAAPEAIVMMDRDGDHAMSDDQIAAHPALGITPAGQAGRVVRMDGMFLLGFGPRTPDAARALMDALYGGA